MRKQALEYIRQAVNLFVREYLNQYHGKEWEKRSSILFSFEDWLFEKVESTQD